MALAIRIWLTASIFTFSYAQEPTAPTPQPPPSVATTTKAPAAPSAPATNPAATTATQPTPSTPAAPLAAPAANQPRRRLKQILAIFEIEIAGKPAGAMKARLFIDKAPKTVENFMGLVEGTHEFTEFNAKKGPIGKPVKRPFYDGLTFHRLSPGYIVQGGCPFGTGRGGPGFTIPDEISTELRHDSAGFLSMARTEKKDSAGSQFFITLAPLKHLDGKYAIFGRLIEGQEVLKKMATVKVDPINDHPLEPIVMKSVKIQKEYFP